MRAVLVGLAVAALSAGAAVAGPAQFDLVCTGAAKDEVAGTQTPWSDRISVDLSAGAYCEQVCATPKAITLVEPGYLFFVGGRLVTGAPTAGPAFFINRVTGEVFKRDYGPAMAGKCSIEPFTAFPKNLF